MSKQRQIRILYKPLIAEYDIITAEHALIMNEIEHVAATHGKLVLPLTFPQTHEHPDNTTRIIHSVLLKLDETKADITDAQWREYAERYNRLIETHGSHQTNPEAQRLIHFTDAMSKLITAIGDYIITKGVPVPKAIYGGEPSPRVISIVALLHAVEWLKQKQKEESQNDLTSQ